MGKLTDIAIRAWIRSGKRFEGRTDGDGLSERMPQALTLRALDVAIGWREPEAGLVHHSDRGSHYAAEDYRKKLAVRGVTLSMSRRGNWSWS
jgi:transposase InsO family protein